MKIASYWWGGRRQVGLVDDAGASVTPLACAGTDAPVARHGALALVEQLVDGKPLPRANGTRLPLSTIRLAPPLTPRRNVFCVGVNYRAHAVEFARSGFGGQSAPPPQDRPEAPVIFSKVPECLIGCGDPIVLPGSLSTAIDYESELVVVIGRGGRGIPAREAMAHVFGYTVFNDVTARDLQRRHRQWLIGKSLDGFGPIGPWIVTADEVDGNDTRVRGWVNGELRQDARTTDLIFTVPDLIAAISAGITLQAGDLIATGTPAGVGIGFDPPRFLAAGDTVRIEIDGIGVLENPVRDP